MAAVVPEGIQDTSTTRAASTASMSSNNQSTISNNNNNNNNENVSNSTPVKNLNTRNPAVKRIMHEFNQMQKDPFFDFVASPLDTDLFEWHFTIRGPSKTEFDGGLYHGKILLPSEYPHKPPDFVFLTPSGRFQVNQKICLSNTSYHANTWQASWTIRTMLVALISMFPEPGKGAIGALDCSKAERASLASKSLKWKCDTCGTCNCELLSNENNNNNNNIQFSPALSSTSSNSQLTSPTQLAATTTPNLLPIAPMDLNLQQQQLLQQDDAKSLNITEQKTSPASSSSSSTTTSADSNVRLRRSSSIKSPTTTSVPSRQQQRKQFWLSLLTILLSIAIAVLLYRRFSSHRNFFLR